MSQQLQLRPTFDRKKQSSSIANLKSTAVYTMELLGPTIPQNASAVIQQFDITGEEQRIHFDLGFKNTSYNDYGFNKSKSL